MHCKHTVALPSTGKQRRKRVKPHSQNAVAGDTLHLGRDTSVFWLFGSNVGHASARLVLRATQDACRRQNFVFTKVVKHMATYQC